MAHNLTERYLDALDALASTPLSEAVLMQAKMCLMDYVACAMLGETIAPDAGDAYRSSAWSERGGAALIGMQAHAPMHVAALLNGTHAHAAELDDGHRYAMMHAGAPVISALLAVAEARSLTGAQLLLGIVMGYEAEIRLASAVQPAHKLRGYHGTATCGTIGAALAIAYACGYTRGQRKAALSAAVTNAAGVLEMMDDASTLKPFNVGRAAAAGLDAALVAELGYEGPEDALGGKRGFVGAMAGEVKEEFLTEGFGDRYAIETGYRKQYAACRHSHAAIEAALKAVEGTGIAPESIEDVLVETYGLAVYGHDHTEIANVSSAKMSIPFSVAVALATGKAGYQQFSQHTLTDGLVLDLTGKVRVHELPELSALVPAKRAAIVTVRANGTEHSARVDYPKGEPENPLAPGELEDKFSDLLGAAGRRDDEIRDMLHTIWEVEDALPHLLSVL